MPLGVATFTTNQLPGGAHNFTATYSGDANYVSSASPLALLSRFSRRPRRSALSFCRGAVVGGNVTVNITIVAASGVGTPSGMVTVVPQGTGATVTYTGTLTRSGANSASATVTYAATQVGSTTLLVNCSGDVSLSCFSPVSVQAVVGKAPSTTLLTFAPNSPLPGQAITLTATVPPRGNGRGDWHRHVYGMARRLSTARLLSPASLRLPRSSLLANISSPQLMEETRILPPAPLFR